MAEIVEPSRGIGVHSCLSSEVWDSLVFEVARGWQVAPREAAGLTHEALHRFEAQNLCSHEVIGAIRREVLGDLKTAPFMDDFSIPSYMQAFRRGARVEGSLVSARNVHFEYGARHIIERADFTLDFGDKVGVVGRNGSGMSTLVKLLLGQLEPTKGSLEVDKKASIFHLPQIAAALIGKDTLVIEEVKKSPAPLAEIRKELQRLESLQPTNNAHAIWLVEREDLLRTNYRTMGGNELEGRYHSILEAFGLGGENLYRPLGQLSGGELTKLFLARAVLEAPDFLIMDEPTNHLDLNGIAWLQRFLIDWPRGFLCVSHERELLKTTCGTILELDSGRARYYPVDYDRYLHQREVDRLQNERLINEKEEAIERALATYRRLNKGTTSSRARVFRDRAERLSQELPEERKKTAAVREIRLSTDRHIPELLFSGHSLGIGYPGMLLHRLPERLDLRKSDRIGLIGPNGIGKSTLLRTIVGELPVLEGESRLNRNIDVGYLSQAGIGDPTSETAVEILMGTEDVSYGRVRKILAGLAIAPESLSTAVTNMSGGEQAKISLARIIIRNPDLILLDEPTNHLDIECREALERALKDFDGGVLVASHDRYFLRRVCNKIWELTNAGLRVLPVEYLENLNRFQ